MTKLISKLWHGTLDPIRFIETHNPEISHLKQLMQNNLKRLEGAMDTTTEHIFAAYNDCINEYVLIMSEEIFCNGFCLGAKITAEALNEADKICELRETT